MPTPPSLTPPFELDEFPDLALPARRGDTRPSPGASAPSAHLLLALDDGRQLPIGRHLSIGSAPDNDLVLADPCASAHHCVVGRSGSRVVLVDLGSSNGTFVAGARVTRAELRAGVRLTVGETTLRVQSERGQVADPMIGKSPAMRRLRGEIARVAPTRATVLLLGESGTGKELAARAVHDQSGRRGQFVALNCGAISPELVESELFGHERGAFTGAAGRRPGVFVEADGGTLFLDEIAELPMGLQAKLLRVLETGMVRPVGASGERRVDVRVVAATHQDMKRAVADKRFRLDLYHRLATLEVRLPPLRERKEDIAQLAHHFLESLADEVGARALSDAALAALVAHPWPGNVRELRNAIHRGAVFGGLTLGPEDVLPQATPERAAPALRPYEPYEIVSPETPATGGERLDDIERRAIERALRQTGGNRRQAAAALGVPKSTLCDKVRRYGINVDNE